ncbi:MAG: aminoacyl-tRNA hydrolase [Elusimicrobiota bacterium]
MSIKLIVGLGNPGKGYEKTRHNLGFQAVEMLADIWKSGWKLEKKFKSLVSAPGSSGVRLLVKPQTYMNNSGSAVRAVLDYYGIAPEEMLVISDDFSLPFEKIRLRKSGSDGGHNGLASIIENISTSVFPRLRMGIGPVPPWIDPADFVLSKFDKSQKENVENIKLEAVRVVRMILDEGWEKAASKIPKQKEDGKK